MFMGIYHGGRRSGTVVKIEPGYLSFHFNGVRVARTASKGPILLGSFNFLLKTFTIAHASSGISAALPSVAPFTWVTELSGYHKSISYIHGINSQVVQVAWDAL